MSIPHDDALDSEFRRRLDTVQAGMRDDGLDVLVSADSGDWLPPTGDARYLTGFTITNLLPAFRGLAIVVPAAGDAVLVLPGGPQGCFADWARRTARNAVVREAPELTTGIADVVRAVGRPGARVAVEQRFEDFDRLPGMLSGFEVVDASAVDVTGSGRGPLARARTVKSEYEIGLLATAQAAADNGMRAFRRGLAAGARNVLAQSAAREASIRASADSALVIMNAGNDPWMWWHYQGDRTVPADGIVSVEVNARIQGYTAQLARSGTMGRTGDRERHLLDAGVASLDEMVRALRPGATGHDVWSAGITSLRRAGLESWGRLGHGMGLAMDEGIAVVEGDETSFEVGAVIAVHAAPWDAEQRQSALIGEQYVIRSDGPELLSDAVPPRTWTNDTERWEGEK